MILGYKKNWPWGGETDFKVKIIAGMKKHSMREDKKNRWKPGMLIQHAYGRRTKNYMQFFEGVCKSVQSITIEYDDINIPKTSYFLYFYGNAMCRSFVVKIDNRVLSIPEIELLAFNDGFDSTHDFFRWFFKGFEGKIIHFTDLKY